MRAEKRKGGGNESEERNKQKEDGAGDESLLDGLVDIVDIAREDGFGYIGEHTTEGLHLARHPAEALTLEVVTIAHLLVHDIDVLGIMYIDALLQEQGFQFAVFHGRVELANMVSEPVVAEAHAGADEGRRQADAVMAPAEDAVVDFLADAVEGGYVVVYILGRAVALDGRIAFLTLYIQKRQEVGPHHIVCIENDNVIIEVRGER